MNYLKEDNVDPLADQTNPIWSGKIARDVTALTEMAYAVLDNTQEADSQIGPCYWQARDNFTTPKRGDKCLVTFDSESRPWIMAWWPPNAPPTSTPADFVYNGAYPTGTPYNDGDIVIHNGIAYLCVRPTSNPPVAWSASVGGIPPVIEGQYLKGSGGALTWAPITAGDITGSTFGLFLKGWSGGSSIWSGLADADVPSLSASGRLYDTALQIPGNDWNQVTKNGFYMASTAANAPDGAWWIGLVLVHNYLWQVQLLFAFTQGPPPTRRTRAMQNGGWSAWTAW